MLFKMAKMNRGRFTVSANIILTALVITRGFSFGFIMMSFYIKYGDDILDYNVIKIADIEHAAGMPLGTAVKSVVFSFIGVFVLELITGVCGMLGVLRHSKTMLSITVVMNSIMIVIYGIYIVILSIIYHKKNSLNKLATYTLAYESVGPSLYRTRIFPAFKRLLNCQGLIHPTTYSTLHIDDVYDCRDAYSERYSTYIETYFGLIVTCIMCQVVSIIAVEYTYRKLEFKENKSRIAKNKYYLLLLLQYGIFRNFVFFVKKNWKRSKVIFISSLLKIISLIVAAGLLGLGLTLIGDVMISDYNIRYIFYRIEFYDYYFYDILVGVAASAVVIGILTMINAIVGLFGSWRKSPTLIVTSTVTSLVLTIPRIIAFLIWVVFMAKINQDIKFQLKLLQDGYYFNNNYYEKITKYWMHMLLTLQCCGEDTFCSKHGDGFCCVNAHESNMDITHGTYTSSNVLNPFGGCGGLRTSTCSDSILFKTRMYIGWFLALLLLQICLETVTVLLANQEYSVILSIEKSKKTNLFHKILKCIKSILLSAWRRSKVASTSIGSILILSVGVLVLAINIRYDLVFGNRYIQDLLSQIHIENISLQASINFFSIVTVTFSAINILASIYSTMIIVMVCEKWRYRLTILSLCLWCALVIASIIQLGLMAKVTADINPKLEEKLQYEIKRYQYSNASAQYASFYSKNWNTLFIKAKCCGVGAPNDVSFYGSIWYSSSSNQHIPVQCCKSQTILYPYANQTDENCTHFRLPDSYHNQGCDVAIENQLQKYSIPFMVFTSIIIVAEICFIVQNAQSLISSRKISSVEQQFVGTDRTVEKSCSTTSKFDRKHSNENVRYTEQTTNIKTETSVIRIESLNMANISSEEKVLNSIAFKPTVTLGNETDKNHENMPEHDKKIIGDNSETTDVDSGYEKNDQEGIKMTSLEENSNVLSEEQISEKNKVTERNDDTSTSLDVDN